MRNKKGFALPITIFIVGIIIIFFLVKPPADDIPDETPPPPVNGTEDPDLPPQDPKALTILKNSIDGLPGVGLRIPNTNKCSPLKTPVNERQAINIVVVTSGFNVATRNDQVTNAFYTHPNSMFNLEPYKSRESEFNLWVYPEQIPNTILNQHRVNDQLDLLNIEQIGDAELNCPNNYIVILSSASRGGWTERPIIVTVFSFSSERRASTTSHELGGHLIGWLNDEYVGEFASHGFLCSNNPDCSRYAGIEIEGCFQGCAQDRFYRTSENSIMRSGLNQTTFNTVSQFIINRRIDIQIAQNMNAAFDR